MVLALIQDEEEQEEKDEEEEEEEEEEEQQRQLIGNCLSSMDSSICQAGPGMGKHLSSKYQSPVKQVILLHNIYI